MKTLMLAAVAGVLSLGLWSVAADRTPAVDPVTTRSIPAPAGTHSYTISNVVANTACLAERGGRISSRSERFAANIDCDAVWPRLSAARTWVNNGDGTVVVADAQGEPILTVVDGDGLAYEAVEPADAMITMISAD
ncbi:hypothetical protein KYK30_25420 [Shinella yambaruensis]|uniref:Alkaline proteinase inhibitor/ Outer membrane lipoprotein Omp19 domain-containing protein n=1 Tax=Shinella yambaruensis TaxID=415996 RepID=A0ABQ5ZFL0_9HYPH|nr:MULTISPECIES: hypothetical protein [Shinella]CAI0339368.1 conserved exported hypothetical protein [Rhizobiaceae bacterium]CAK7257773.1 Alkaline proteinase inhibitor/ Outer membrane lipoprotein Omp19 domain-containing protein [Shinella sp. WSC3-e]MCJ8026842.1 hypothetical protein [Shinella yambaruensis]MCO5140812.1 hypothetical protein [Shinella sp.]MCU7983050.1 hypothetical protein [Shinella yambaruensis]